MVSNTILVSLTMTLQEDLKQRTRRLATMLEEAEAAVIATPVNIFYLTGRIINGYVYIDGSANRLVFLRRPLGINETGYHYIRKVEQIPDLLREYGIRVPEKLLLETDELPYNDCMRICKAFGCEKPGNATKALRSLRSIKSGYEIGLLRQSARLQSEALAEIPALFKPGMTDHELCVECERLFRMKGCLGLFRTYGTDMEGFMGSLLAGDNADTPSPYDFALGGAGMHPSLPLGDNGTALREGIAVMVDINGNFNGYIADQSRTFSVGRLPDEAYRAHEVSLSIHHSISEIAKEGTVCEDLYALALDIAEKNGLKDRFMGHRQQAKFVGHGIGLQINELPVLCAKNTSCLQQGNVIAIEPKFIIDGVGAVGIENSYAVNADGLEKLTTAEENILQLGR